MHDPLDTNGEICASTSTRLQSESFVYPLTGATVCRESVSVTGRIGFDWD